MAHCFSCGYSAASLGYLLETLGGMDLLPTETAVLDRPLPNVLFALEDGSEEVDDELGVVSLSDFWQRTFTHSYLQGRGFTYENYDRFPVGTGIIVVCAKASD